MAEFCPAGAPFGISRPADKLDLVQGIVDKRLQLVLRRDVPIQCQPRPYADGYSLGSG